MHTLITVWTTIRHMMGDGLLYILACLALLIIVVLSVWPDADDDEHT
jgi:hypothetical protein